MDRMKLTDFVQKEFFRKAVLISLILCVLIFLIIFPYFLRIFQQEEISRAVRLERDWSNTIEYFGKLLNVVSVETPIFESEETILRLLQRIYGNLTPLVAYPAFGRADGKMFSYPPYDYGPTYDPRERPWYRSASQKSEEYVIVGTFIHAILNEPVIAIAKAVLDRDGKLVGVLALDLVASRIAEGLLVENSYIVDSAGHIIAKKGTIKGVFKPQLAGEKRSFHGWSA